MQNRPLAILITLVALVAAGCGGAPTASLTASPTAPPEPTATATAGSTPVGTPTPTPTAAPTIGVPADDGARIIAVDLNPPVIHCVDSGCSDPVTVPGRRARDLTIDSPAVGIVQVRLLLPAHFDAQPSTRWPVLYLLGGGGSSYTNWTEWQSVEAMTAEVDLLVVMPDCGKDDPGGVGCSYTDWWQAGPRQWETFHLVELRQLLERNWQAGDKRAVAGFSAGGYGAIEYATRQPRMFLFAAAFSGFFNPRAGSLVWGFPPKAMWGDPTAQADIWTAHDPMTNAAALKGIGLFVSYGNGEPGPLDNGKPSIWDPDGSGERELAAEGAAFVKRLGELKIPVTVDAYGNGTHHELYWDREFQRSLPLILKALGL